MRDKKSNATYLQGCLEVMKINPRLFEAHSFMIRPLLARAQVGVEGCSLHFLGGHMEAQGPPGLALPPPSYLVHMMDDSRLSSDQMRAVQSPTVRKFFGKNGFLCRA